MFQGQFRTKREHRVKERKGTILKALILYFMQSLVEFLKVVGWSDARVVNILYLLIETDSWNIKFIPIIRKQEIIIYASV